MSETVNTLATVIGLCFAGSWLCDACAYLVDAVRFFKS